MSQLKPSLISVLVILSCLVLSCQKDQLVPVNGYPIIESTSDIWEIEEVDNGCIIIAYLGRDLNLLVPTKVDNLNVL
ncbi:MAG: hypothetical protein ACI9UJ_002116, partial [bacterium]